MKRVIILSTALLFVFSSCSFTKYEETGTAIVSAREAIELVESGYVLVDAQKKTSWQKEHVAGSANIERKEINVSEPVANSVAPASVVAEAAGNAGLTTDTDILIYDDNSNMDSGRLYWTLKYYGHKGDIRVVSGGLAALKERGAEIVEGTETVASKQYSPSPADDSMMALMEDITPLLDDPRENVVLLDVRSDEEYNAGTIPGAVHINYENNNFSDGTLKPVQHIKILYKEAGILPDDEIIMYCKSSVRAANTYVTLYNAGYRNLKIYDGAWLEWSQSGNAVYKPDVAMPTVTTSQDNS